MLKNIALIPGYLEITDDRDRKSQIAIADVLRAADVPDLNISSLTLLTDLAQLVMVLVKTLIEKGILDEQLIEGYDMQWLLDTLTENLEAED